MWDTLEIHWKEMIVTFNDNKVNLPRVVMIKLQDKIKIRCLMKKETFTLPPNIQAGNYVVYFGCSHARDCINNTTKNSKFEMTIKLIFQMAFILRPKCNLLNGYFRCLLPLETVDIEVKVKMMRGIHTFKRDRTTEVITCNPWSTSLHPTPLSSER